MKANLNIKIMFSLDAPFKKNTSFFCLFDSVIVILYNYKNIETMKKLLLLITFFACLFTACSKGDINTELKGQTFEYWNGEYGSSLIRISYKFEKSGNVYHTSKIGNLSEYNTKGCSLYYTLDDRELKIYHGNKGWKKEVRNTIYASGEYYGDYLIIGGNKYIRK